MYPAKINKYLQAVLIAAISLFLFSPAPANAFPQSGGAAGAAPGGGESGGIVMQAVSGKVVETMDSGGYTYALVEGQTGQAWVALPKSPIAVGNEITCQPGMVMNNFRSSSLNRTFEHIVFSQGITSITGEAVTSGNAGTPEAATTQEEPADLPKVEVTKDWGDFFNKGDQEK